MATNYEKKLLNEIKELKEGSVPKDILFANAAAHRREVEHKSAIIEKLREQKLTQSQELCALRKSEGEFREQFQTQLETMPLPDYVLVDENEKLKEDNLYLKEQLFDLQMAACKCRAENEELKKNGGFVGDYATATSANALLARQKDSELKKLKEENENLKEEKYENNEFRLDLGVIMDKHDICRDEEIDVVFERTLVENEKLKRDIDDALESYMEVFKEE